MSRKDFRHIGQKGCQNILLFNDTLPKARRARELDAFGESTTSQLELPSSTEIQWKCCLSMSFFWNSSRAHLLLYKISRSWIDRVGLGSGSSSHRLLDSGQGLREKHVKVATHIVRKNLYWWIEWNRDEGLWYESLPVWAKFEALTFSKGRPPQTVFWGKRGGANS